MITIKNLLVQFGDRILFNHISCLIKKNDRIGLIGRNGTGKSTLLKLIAKKIQPDDGSIIIQKSAKIAYMSQEVVITSDRTILNEALSTFEHLFKLYEEKLKIESNLDLATEAEINRYATIEHQLFEENFNQKRADAEKMLSGLGFDENRQQQSVETLSVGWRMRIVLAKLLLQNADFYLFDEPTNHLDLSTKEWFLKFLNNSSFGYLLVCHDRYFLDKACNEIIELAAGKLNRYNGNYSYFKKHKAIRLEHQLASYKKQQQEMKLKERTIERFRYKSSKAKMAQSMERSLDKVERIEIENKQKNIHLKLDPVKKSGYEVISVKNVAHSFDKQIFKNISFEIERGNKAAIVAPNGTGKTTLFNLIAKKIELQTGKIQIGQNVKTALFDQDQEKVLNPRNTVFEEVLKSTNLTEQKIRSVLGGLLFSQNDSDKKCSVLSGGERNRVAMAKVILNDANTLLLDEPTNHLDLETKEIILSALQQFDGTILFVSHDQDFVNKLSTKIIELDKDGSITYPGNYDSYIRMKNSKNSPTENRKDNERLKITEKSTPNFDLQKKCKNLENKINKLERNLQKNIAQLGEAEYGTEKFSKLEKKHIELEKEIEEETTKWEKLLDEIEGKS